MAKIIARGIDISSHQGTPDFKKVKAAGYSFVIVKAGQGLREMATFKERFLPAILAVGLDWGAYWWSDAETAAEAKQEAQAFVKALEGLKPAYPVWMDQEYDSPCGRWGVGKGKQLRTDMVNAFCKVLQEAGYYTGLYASADWLNNWVDCTQLATLDKWVADYWRNCPNVDDADASAFAGAHGIWQYTVVGKKGTQYKDFQTYGLVPGLAENCDVNVCYREYPAVIRSAGLNGWSYDKPTTPPEAETVTFTRDEWNELFDHIKT